LVQYRDAATASPRCSTGSLILSSFNLAILLEQAKSLAHPPPDRRTIVEFRAISKLAPDTRRLLLT